jgi:hypothetical protein
VSIRRAVGALAIACAAIVATAAPASAHGGKTIKATNDRPEIIGLDPPVAGVRVRLIDGGSRIELDAGRHRVFVFGYEGEDYLRINSEGVFENLRSPSTYLNRSVAGDVPPATTDPTAPADWSKIADGRVARWHDHSLHTTPGMKLGLTNQASWTRDLLIDDQPVVLRGRIVRLPGSSRLPPLAAAALIAIALVAVARFAWRTAIVGGLAAVVVADIARIVGLVAHTPSWMSSRPRAVIDLATLPFIGWGMAVCAVVLLAKRRRIEAATAAVVAGAVLAFAGGVLEVGDLAKSVLGTSLPDAMARGGVAVVLGGGVGVSVAALVDLRRATSTRGRRRPRTGSGPSPGDGTRRGSASAPASGSRSTSASG